MRWCLAGDRRGAAAVEFALVGSAFFLALMLVMETCWQVAVAAALDYGCREASRWAATGQAAPSGQTSTGYVTAMILKASGIPLAASALVVTADSVPNFTALTVAGASKPGLGGPGDVVRYTVTYSALGLTPVGRTLLPLGTLQHHLVILAKNEPYPAS